MRLASAWPFALMAALALLPTGKFLFGGMTPAPVDQVHQLPPWNGPRPDAPWDLLQLDGALQFLPWRDYMLERLRAGEIPLRNPYALGGAPFLANSQTAPLYPLHLFWAATPWDAEALLAFTAWLHLFLGGLGVYLLCLRLDASRAGAVIGGSGFALGAFMVAWIQLPSVVMTAAWIPWCLLGVLRLFAGGRNLPRDTAKLAFAVALVLLAGHLQIAAYGLMAAFLYALWLLAARRRLAPACWAAAGLALGAAVASPQLLPAVETGRQGHRAAAPTQDGWLGHRAQALSAGHLVVFVDPAFYGLPNRWADGEPGVPDYWLARREPGRHYAEMAFWVGPVVLVLGFVGLGRNWRRPEVSFFGLLLAFGLLVALGTFAAKVLYFGIPGWSATGSPGRAAVLCSLSLCAAAGCAFPRGLSLPSRVAAWTGAAVSAALLSYVHWPLNPGSPRGLFREPFPGLEALKAVEGRVAVVNSDWKFTSPFPKGASEERPWLALAPPNSLLPYRVAEAGGYDSIVPRAAKERLDRINGRDSAPPANGNMMFVKPGFSVELLSEAGVAAVMATGDLPYEVLYEGRGWRLYELPGQPRGAGPGAAAPRAAGGTEALRAGFLLGMFGLFATVLLSCMGVREGPDEPTSDPA